MADTEPKFVTVRVSHEVTMTRYVDVVVTADPSRLSHGSPETRAKDYVLAATSIGQPLDWRIDGDSDFSFQRYGLAAQMLGGEDPDFAEVDERPVSQPPPATAIEEQF